MCQNYRKKKNILSSLTNWALFDLRDVDPGVWFSCPTLLPNKYKQIGIRVGNEEQQNIDKNKLYYVDLT